MNREKLEKMLKDRWHDKAVLLVDADALFKRSVEWGEKQNEPFYEVLNDMETWRADFRSYLDRLESDLRTMGKM